MLPWKHSDFVFLNHPSPSIFISRWLLLFIRALCVLQSRNNYMGEARSMLTTIKTVVIKTLHLNAQLQSLRKIN